MNTDRVNPWIVAIAALILGAWLFGCTPPQPTGGDLWKIPQLKRM